MLKLLDGIALAGYFVQALQLVEIACFLGCAELLVEHVEHMPVPH